MDVFIQMYALSISLIFSYRLYLCYILININIHIENLSENEGSYTQKYIMYHIKWKLVQIYWFIELNWDEVYGSKNKQISNFIYITKLYVKIACNWIYHLLT